jgi:hypothetical protein
MTLAALRAGSLPLWAAPAMSVAAAKTTYGFRREADES